MLETADEIMKAQAKRDLFSLAETLRRHMIEEVEEKIEEDWGVKLRQEEAQSDSQQTTEEIDEEVLSPGLRRMSDSLSAVSLGAPAGASPLTRTRQERRDSPAPALNDRSRRTRISQRLAGTMHAIEEESDDKLDAMDSNDRKRLKRKHEGFLDKVEKATRAKKPKSKKLRLG